MKIRKAKKADFEEYSKIKEEDFREYSKLIKKNIKYSKKDSNIEFQRILKSKEDYLFFAEDKEKIIGFIHGEIENNKSGKKADIEYIHVIKEYRKKGIASKLINAFINVAKSKKCNYLTLKVNKKNTHAIKLYNKFRFEITNYVMRKQIK